MILELFLRSTFLESLRVFRHDVSEGSFTIDDFGRKNPDDPLSPQFSRLHQLDHYRRLDGNISLRQLTFVDDVWFEANWETEKNDYHDFDFFLDDIYYKANAEKILLYVT